MDEEKRRVRQILAGDTPEFQHLVENYQKLVAHIVFRMIPNASEREDICQDIFLKVYQNLSHFRFESKLSTWIGRIAYNTCINVLEKKKAVLFDDFAAGDQSILDYSMPENSPLKLAEKDDLSIRIQKEIEKIPVHYKTILTLYHLEEMSYAEIGEIMNLPEGTVKSYLFRARKHLKERLLAKYQPEEL